MWAPTLPNFRPKAIPFVQPLAFEPFGLAAFLLTLARLVREFGRWPWGRSTTTALKLYKGFQIIKRPGSSGARVWVSRGVGLRVGSKGLRFGSRSRY